MQALYPRTRHERRKTRVHFNRRVPMMRSSRSARQWSADHVLATCHGGAVDDGGKERYPETVPCFSPGGQVGAIRRQQRRPLLLPGKNYPHAGIWDPSSRSKKKQLRSVGAPSRENGPDCRGGKIGRWVKSIQDPCGADFRNPASPLPGGCVGRKGPRAGYRVRNGSAWRR